MKKEDENSEPAKNQWLEFLNLGWLFAATMTATVLGGLKLDQIFHKAPIFLLVGTIFGFIGCAYFLTRLIKKLNR